MKTTVYKDMRNNWHAETHIPLEGKQQLRLSTWKTDRGLTSFASVCDVENGIVSHAIFQDYSKWLFREKVRVTEKAVREQHERALALVPTLLADVAAHYAEKAA